MDYLKRILLVSVGALALLLPPGKVLAQEEDPFVCEIPGIRLCKGSRFEKFAAISFRIETDDGLIKEEVRGLMAELAYEDEDGGRVWSPLEISRITAPPLWSGRN